MSVILMCTAIATFGSLVFDGIVTYWHWQDRKRFAADEKRLADDEREMRKNNAHDYARAEPLRCPVRRAARRLVFHSVPVPPGPDSVRPRERH